MEIRKQHLMTAAVLGIALATPSIALAQSNEGIFGLLRWIIEFFKLGQETLGYLLGFIGLAAMGFGIFHIIQHFRTESRDDPNQKSRLVFGGVSFLCGILLAGGAYQRIGSEESFSATSYEAVPSESVFIVHTDSQVDTTFI